MNVEGQNWFPYLPSGWLQRLVDLMRRSVPQRIDADWCLEGNRFSFTRNNASQFISQLKTLGWLNEDGTLTEGGRSLRLNGEPYRSFMRNEVTRVYDELDDQVRDEQFDREDLDTYFTSASSLGLSGRRQVITTFRWFVGQAGLDELSARMGGGVVSSAPRTRQRGNRQASGQRTSPQAGAATADATRGGGVSRDERRSLLPAGLAGLTLSISLQLPAVEDERVYQAIFKAMREHLFGQEASPES